jgi:hypothetical protein
MLNYFRVPGRTSPSYYILSATFVAIALCGKPVPANAHSPAGGGRLTQYRINEFAADCLTCEMAFSGFKGNPLPGESKAQFAARVEGCLAAVDALARKAEAWRTAPEMQNTRPENLERWRKITRAAAGLPSASRQARAAWHAFREGQVQSPFGRNLMTCLGAVQFLLNNLREALP